MFEENCHWSKQNWQYYKNINTNNHKNFHRSVVAKGNSGTEDMSLELERTNPSEWLTNNHWPKSVSVICLIFHSSQVVRVSFLNFFPALNNI